MNKPFLAPPRPTEDEIEEAHDLIAAAIGGPGWTEEDQMALRGSFTALHWILGGCNCEGRRSFQTLLIRLRQKRDQLEAEQRGNI